MFSNMFDIHRDSHFSAYILLPFAKKTALFIVIVEYNFKLEAEKLEKFDFPIKIRKKSGKKVEKSVAVLC